MKNVSILVILVLGASQHLSGQAKLRKMPPNINHSSINNYAPYISLDGNTMVYIADVAEDNVLTMCYSSREGVNWKDPVTLSKSLNSRLNFLKGFGLSPDGKTLFISNSKGNGLGGFDLYTSQFTGLLWTEPVNMGLPVNSKSHEACPSLSVDGSILYFMRCEKMDFAKADNCKIMMMTKKPNGQWGQPVELPASINSGNSQTPRIMGDGETLVFSSNKIQPNKGGMDLYFTRLTNGQWSNPQPLDFVNTPNDDQYVSATSLGRYLVKDMPGTHESELVEILFPADTRPRSTMKIEGTVAGIENPTSAYVTIYNLLNQSRVFSTRPGKDGTFVAYVKEGGVYDLSVDPEQDNFTFFSKKFDMTTEKFSLVEKVTAPLKPLASGDEIALNGISFISYSHELNPTSTQELQRLVRLLKGNPDKYFSLRVTHKGFEKDSVRSGPDLTESHVDTLRIPVTYPVDSVTTATRDSLVIKTTYHNDRTLRQAKVVCDYLISNGVTAGKIACSGISLPEAIPENRKTLIDVIVH